MTAPDTGPPSDPAALPPTTALTDGGWHRLHPATPLLRGGIVLIAILGFVLANFRERLVDWVFGAPELPGDPLQTAYERGQIGWLSLIVVAALVVGVVSFYVSWRLHTFRVGDDVVEVRSGVLFRTHRRARLDRIQGVSISRPFFARLFGAARLEISVAGQDAKVQLAYLGSTQADDLRRDVLLLASGAQLAHAQATGAPTALPLDPATIAQAGAEASAGADAVPHADTVAGASATHPGLVNQRMRELLAPELDPALAAPESVVKIPPGRLIASLVLSGFTVVLLIVAAFIVVSSVMGERGLFVILIVPGLAAAIGYYFNRFTKSLRYSIAGTPDGVRVGFGLLSTSNDTLPPGRIHAIEVSQPLLWRPAGWWMIRINRAGAAGEGSAQTSTTMLPVGTLDDVRTVLGLLLPSLAHPAAEAGSDGAGPYETAAPSTRDIVLAGLTARSGDGFTDAPRRAWPIRPLSWRRTGWALTDDAVLLRSGFVWRHLSVVPLARVQSLRISQGPLLRMLDLVDLAVQTVAGPVRASVPAADRATGTAAFELVTARVVDASRTDTSHRWSARAAPPPPTPLTPPAPSIPPASSTPPAPSTPPTPSTPEGDPR
ncbi:PH domain-containing protein [Herbiconiux sp. CPCC 205716]|uniref:PH domain-containing protein n=1 Tax=Herbiconiux gentiana TaxID=2970912 RepID=A0ABT2GH77_9MICO|nr:PH domain-containing protein [Herbiconiux gentiana]MCS5714947.1 PH domain-containing protein [Herbiconiux gentiana]